MKKLNKNKYYNDDDEINFKKLDNFKKFNSNIQNNNSSKNYSIKYSGSDKNYFNNIIKNKENVSLLNEKNIKKEIKYYNSSDFQKFDYLNSHMEYHNNIEQKSNENTKSKLSYTSSDYGEFNKIILTKNKEEKIINDQNKKIKVIDYGKSKENEKKIKNKLGIEKIKVVYFD